MNSPKKKFIKNPKEIFIEQCKELLRKIADDKDLLDEGHSETIREQLLSLLKEQRLSDLSREFKKQLPPCNKTLKKKIQSSEGLKTTIFLRRIHNILLNLEKNKKLREIPESLTTFDVDLIRSKIAECLTALGEKPTKIEKALAGYQERKIQEEQESISEIMEVYRKPNVNLHMLSKNKSRTRKERKKERKKTDKSARLKGIREDKSEREASRSGRLLRRNPKKYKRKRKSNKGENII